MKPILDSQVAGRDESRLRVPSERFVRARARAQVGTGIARSGEMEARIRALEAAVGRAEERRTSPSPAAEVPEAPDVAYLQRFTQGSTAVQRAVVLCLENAAALLAHHRSAPPEALAPCVCAVHDWFFTLHRQLGTWLESEAASTETRSRMAGALVDYSEKCVSCKIEPAIERLLVQCEELKTRDDVGNAGVGLDSAVQRLCRAVTGLNDGLRVRR